MANDPNRDLLPVKEDYIKIRPGPSERIDHQSLSKLSRFELEDKVHTLLDEHLHLKKLANSQEEKIKRLGTKLLRLINDKKHGGKSLDQGKVSEDIHFQCVELEHENYALKDKITVLKQQLASHSHQNIIRSPVRSNHTSPLMSVRQSAPNFQNDIVYQSTNKAVTSDVQLQEAEAHIKLLNNEIKSLHNKIEYLQQDLEKSSLDNRKTKVTENIEFIRLQRSLKQQAIQIAALQAQIKNSETSQNILKEELIKAHNENDEALHLIASKQNEILNLCSKLEEKNLTRLEENDLKQRIHDLVLERNSLKERADLLLKTIQEKTEETEKTKVLKTLLAQEKCKTKKLEKILETKPYYSKNFNGPSSQDESSVETEVSNFPLIETKEEHCLLDTKANAKEVLLKSITYEELGKKDGWTSPMHKYRNRECKSVQTEKINSGLINEKDSEEFDDVDSIEREGGEKIKLELEVQHLREMLRSQTSRCEAQQNEISRLKLELKLSEDRFRSTLQKLDKRLSAFENLENQSRKEIGSPSRKSPVRTLAPSFKPIPAVRSNAPSEDSIPEVETISGKVTTPANDVERIQKQMSLSSESSVSEHPLASHEQILPDVKSRSPLEISNDGKRFVDQVFLESSDEDQPINAPLKEATHSRERSESDELYLGPISKIKSVEGKQFVIPKSSKIHLKRSKQIITPISSPGKLSSDVIFQEKKTQSGMKVVNKAKAQSSREGQQKVLISIKWLDIDPESSLWKNDLIKLLFVDFTFLDLRGEVTETPESLPKPTVKGEKCKFKFVKEVEMDENRRRILKGLLNKPDMDLIIFKVVSDCEEYNQSTDFECEDVGVAVVTVKQFLDKCNKGSFTILVNNTEDTEEVVGKLAISIEITPDLFSPRN